MSRHQQPRQITGDDLTRYPAQPLEHFDGDVWVPIPGYLGEPLDPDGWAIEWIAPPDWSEQ